MAWSSYVERLYEFLQEVRDLVKNTEKNQTEIEDLRVELKEVTEILRLLISQIERAQDRMADQRKIDELKMKNFKLQVESIVGQKIPEDTGGD
ncbi:MAG TPA: hypothetical protein VK582_03070 [Pyrinomonadaceae bacterium]|nr:hypothetical protein [Pyrinomonadaceae bacterium]